MLTREEEEEEETQKNRETSHVSLSLFLSSPTHSALLYRFSLFAFETARVSNITSPPPPHAAISRASPPHCVLCLILLDFFIYTRDITTLVWGKENKKKQKSNAQ